MSSDSEQSGGEYASSKSGRIEPTTKNSKEKRKRATKVDSSSSDTPSSREVRVKKARASKKVKAANKTKSLDGNESSSEDNQKENSDGLSNSEESTGNKSVGASCMNEVQKRCSDNVIDSSDDEDKTSSSKLSEQKSQTGSMNTVGDRNKSNTDSDSSLLLKSSNKSDSSSTGSSDKARINKYEAAHVRKKKTVKKEKLLSKQIKNYESSDDEYSEKVKVSCERNKSKIGKYMREDSSAKESTDDSSLENKEESGERDKERGSAEKKISFNAVKDNSCSFDSMKEVSGPEKAAQQNKKLERAKRETGSELSENDEPTSDSSGSADISDSKVKKTIGKPTNKYVDSKKQMKKLPKITQNKSSNVTTSKQKSCQNSSNSDSGLEGSDKDVKWKTLGKVKTNEKLNRKIECKVSVSSSGSDSEPLIKKLNEKHPVEKSVSSGSSCEPDKQSKETQKESRKPRSSFSDDEQKTKNVHLVSSSGSESEEDGSKAAKKKEVKGKKQKSKDEKDVSEKKTKSVEDPHKDRAVMRAKRYVKEAGLRIQNYALLWAGCRSNKARAQAIIDFLHENGLSGTPTLEKCKRLRIKREKKNEASELDLANIISSGRESRRNAMLAPVRKPADNDSPSRQEVKNRFARIQALGDSDSSS